MAPILITLFNHTDVEDCQVRCEMSWAPKTALDLIGDQLEEDLEGTVKVEYIDLAQPQHQTRYGDLARRVKEEILPLPIIAIEGKAVLAGNVEYRAILEAIETYRELGCV